MPSFSSSFNFNQVIQSSVCCPEHTTLVLVFPNHFLDIIFTITKSSPKFSKLFSSNFQKRLEGLTEAELQVLLEQVEEEKRRLASGEQVNWFSFTLLFSSIINFIMNEAWISMYRVGSTQRYCKVLFTYTHWIVESISFIISMCGYPDKKKKKLLITSLILFHSLSILEK